MTAPERPPTPPVPPGGPIEHEPLGIDPATARTMLSAAVVDLPLGTYDERILAWLSGWEPQVIACVASLLRRAFVHGVEKGRMERLDEHPVIAALTARLDEVEAELERRRTATDATTDQE